MMQLHTIQTRYICTLSCVDRQTVKVVTGLSGHGVKMNMSYMYKKTDYSLTSIYLIMSTKKVPPHPQTSHVYIIYRNSQLIIIYLLPKIKANIIFKFKWNLQQNISLTCLFWSKTNISILIYLWNPSWGQDHRRTFLLPSHDKQLIHVVCEINRQTLTRFQ